MDTASGGSSGQERTSSVNHSEDAALEEVKEETSVATDPNSANTPASLPPNSNDVLLDNRNIFDALHHTNSPEVKNETVEGAESDPRRGSHLTMSAAKESFSPEYGVSLVMSSEEIDVNGLNAASLPSDSSYLDQTSSTSSQFKTPPLRARRAANKLAVERIERSSRQLRLQDEEMADIPRRSRASAANHSISQHPQYPDCEVLPSPSKELRPRRGKRKPGHTKRVWRPEVSGDVVERWRSIGETRGMSSDTEIAVFLMQHYENVLTGQPTGAVCISCHSLLTLACVVCHTPSQLTLTPDPTPTPTPASPPSHQQVRLIKQESPEPEPGARGNSDSDPDTETLSTAFDEEGEKEEEKEEEVVEKPLKRKRGRPIGSGKKSSRNKPRKFICTYKGCTAAFAKSARLKIHTRIHTGEKPYSCDVCQKAFTQKSGLTVHMLKHTGVRPFQCSECQARFSSSSTLTQHKRRHTGERPYQCGQCPKSFRWSGHLTQHLRMHEGYKPFLCPDCGKAFSASSDLSKHRVTHTQSRPYQCNLCHKAYSFKHRLTAHKRSHTGDRPFLCSLCGAAFARAHNLTVHVRTHTGDKPYECPDCGAKFSDSGNFSKHKKTKHGTPGRRGHKQPPPLSPNSPTASNSLEPRDLRLPHFGQVISNLDSRLEPGSDRDWLPGMSRVAAEARQAASKTVSILSEQEARSDPSPGPSLCRSAPPLPLSSGTHLRQSSSADISDLKRLLPPGPGSDLRGQALSYVDLGSPASIQSPALTLTQQPSPGPDSDARPSPLPQPAHHGPSAHDGAVFPPQYYGYHYYNYPPQGH